MGTAIDNHSVVQAGEIFKTLSAAVKNFHVYGADHPRFNETCKSLSGLVRSYSDTRSVDSLPFVFKSGQVHLGRVLVPNVGVSGKWLTRVLTTSGFEGLLVRKDISSGEVAAFLRAMVSRFGDREAAPSGSESPSPPGDANGDANLVLIAPGQAHTLSAAGETGESGEEELYLPELEISKNVGYSVLSTYRTILTGINEGRGFDYSYLLKTSERVGLLFSAEDGSLLPDLSQSYFDDFTFHHSVNVSALTTGVVSMVTKDPELLSRIALAALLHDVGKNFIPAEVLHKPAKLSAGEREAMEAHTTLGAKVLLDISDIDPLCVTVAFGHHIYDGPTAYPKTRRPFRLNWLTRLLAVVDVYEALTAMRPYKPGISSLTAFKIMLSMPGLNSRRSFVKMLYDYLGPYPVGSVIELNTGERARIVAKNPDQPFQPKIRLLTDPGGNRLDEAVELDLARPGPSRTTTPWICRTVLPLEQGEDPLTAEYHEEPQSILGAALTDDEVLMAREG